MNDLLYEYIRDPSNPEKCFNLAVAYYKEGQTAAATSFFIRAADRSGDDLNLAYECLLHVGSCFDIQGNRLEHVKGCYKHALSLLPKRPEAYYLLANFQNWNSVFDDSYQLCKQALTVCDFDSPAFRMPTKYPGKWGLIYEKVAGAWNWGKVEEYRSGLKYLYENHLNDMNDFHRDEIIKNCEKHNIELDYNVNSDYIKHDIVLQGPIDGITESVVRDYLQLPFVNNIIVSTWKGENFYYENSRVKVIYNQKPLITSGTCNKNLQIVSSLGGIKECDTEFSIKMRTDQKYTNETMMLFYDFFIKNNGPISGKLFVAATYPHLLFHPRDHVFWGKTSNLLMMFDIPLEYNSLSDKVQLGKYELAQYYDHFVRPETYLGTHYLSKFDDRLKMFLIYPEKHLYDNCEHWAESHALSNELMPKYFEFFPVENTKLYWPKRIDGDGEFKQKEMNAYIHESWHEDEPYKKEEQFYDFNENPQKTVWVVDNFYKNPDQVREYALTREFEIGGIGRGYIGNRTHEQFLFPGMKERFEEIMGKKITKWEEHGMNGRFQYCWGGQPQVWHCDSQQWGGMLYLTPDAPYSCGTSLYAHKKTRARSYYQPGHDADWGDVPEMLASPHLDGTHFEPVDVMGNVYNRLVIFDASCVHSSSGYFGYLKENCRLWQMFFFDT